MMNFLKHNVDQKTYRPIFFDLRKKDDKKELEAYFAQNRIDEVIDALPEALEDLFKIDFPFVAPRSSEYKKTFKRYLERYDTNQDLSEKGVWTYYPWRRSLIHLPHEKDYYKLRTARNKFLITAEEQDKFYNALIGIAGLSVGSSIVNAIVLSGGGGNMRIADPDTLSITNLNRLPASVCDLTRSKCINSARKIFEMDPFNRLEIFREGLTAKNMTTFFQKKNKKLDLFIEEMDNIKLKIESRFLARKLHIPIIMATDNGDNAIIDVERFDLEPQRPLFHGRIDETILHNVPANPSQPEKIKLADKIVGPDVTPRTQLSLTMVGSKLPAWPQLGNAATVSGAATSYIARRILTGEDMPSGRYEVNFDALIDPHYHTKAAKDARAEKKADFIKGFQLLFGEES